MSIMREVGVSKPTVLRGVICVQRQKVGTTIRCAKVVKRPGKRRGRRRGPNAAAGGIGHALAAMNIEAKSLEECCKKSRMRAAGAPRSF
jgi:hypothetical protein